MFSVNIWTLVVPCDESHHAGGHNTSNIRIYNPLDAGSCLKYKKKKSLFNERQQNSLNSDSKKIGANFIMGAVVVVKLWLTQWAAASIWGCGCCCTSLFSWICRRLSLPHKDWDQTSSSCSLLVLLIALKQEESGGEIQSGNRSQWCH